MRLSALIRVGGAFAILAGVLRAASSFASGGSEVERQALYFIVDLLLLLGAFAAYAQNHEEVGRWGAAGFLTTVAGTLLVRSSRAVPGLDLYPAGALSVAIGWVLLTGAWWRTAKGPAFVPVLFALSIVTGLVGQVVSRASLFVASGVIFGAAVARVGGQVLLGVSTASRNRPAACGLECTAHTSVRPIQLGISDDGCRLAACVDAATDQPCQRPVIICGRWAR